MILFMLLCSKLKVIEAACYCDQGSCKQFLMSADILYVFVFIQANLKNEKQQEESMLTITMLIMIIITVHHHMPSKYFPFRNILKF
jgi:hypothetical protein